MISKYSSKFRIIDQFFGTVESSKEFQILSTASEFMAQTMIMLK
jgi:hypothetical protein